jgi:hypothetical protein
MGKDQAIAAITVITLLLSLTFVPTVMKVARADPIPDWFIQVNSPQNDKIYPSNTVEVNFTIIPNPFLNYTSFSYSLDDRDNKSTNGNTVLASLSAGSHKLTIYGTYNAISENQTFTSIVAVLYFSTVFSTTWIVFTVTLAAVVLVIGLLFFARRKQIVARLKGKKTRMFWLGLTSFLLFAALFFVPSVWQMTEDYLFPHYSFELTAYFLPQSIPAIIGLVFMSLGLLLMILGTQKKDTQIEK